ncbi:hypothetical protein [Streptomyces sp. CB02923]|uniref:hypothetical protein n=1 Tax=Streptomyces sp. CB02923 TaxID=1718985 RepID=UPI000ABB1193|nr:hypothetical protein [Streptomyces sp. CB02923]
MNEGTGAVNGGVNDVNGTARHRSRIHELDRDIARLIRLRTDEDRRLQDARRAAGHPRTDLAWENSVLRGYLEALGPDGAQLALLLLGLARRTPPGAAAEQEEGTEERTRQRTGGRTRQRTEERTAERTKEHTSR